MENRHGRSKSVSGAVLRGVVGSKPAQPRGTSDESSESSHENSWGNRRPLRSGDKMISMKGMSNSPGEGELKPFIFPATPIPDCAGSSVGRGLCVEMFHAVKIDADGKEHCVTEDPSESKTTCSPNSSQEQKKTKEATQAAERIRVQELLRYLDPYEAAPPLTTKARIATDSTLTAFAQLAALRLNCERSFVSLLDASHQYIIAEATRTISLKSEDVRDNEDDALFLGQTILDFEWGVCPGTLACFTATDDSLDVDSEYVKAGRQYYVMNDMSALPSYANRPYIAGWPYMKYYAEVPIHSPSGLTIGTLCVVDNKPREGLDEKGLSILRELAEAAMDHLDLCRSKIQRDHAERMLHALGGFVQGSDSVRRRWMEEQDSRLAQPGQRHLTIEERAKLEFDDCTSTDLAKQSTQAAKPVAEIAPVYADVKLNVTPSTETESPSASPFDSANKQAASYFPPKAETPGTDCTSDGLEEKGKKLDDDNQEESPILTELEALLARATNLIREGIGLDGVMFLDPRSTDGMLLTDPNSAVERPKPEEAAELAAAKTAVSENSSAVPNDHAPFDESKSFPIPRSQRYCKTLACSMQRRDKEAVVPQLSEQTLQHMLLNFPRGGVLHYDEQGLIGENDSVFDWDKPGPGSTLLEHTIVAAKDKNAANDLRSNFPRATSIMLFPLWDISHDKLLGYSIAWTTNLNRMFQRGDFAYIAAFGNSVIAEVSRLDIVAADQAKAGFISSISHELRSPLHGIMASVDLLHDLHHEDAADIIRTIESCGSTLLDTMDNLLTFAKIQRPSTDCTCLQQSNMDSDVVDLAVLVEDIVQICIASHSFRNSVETFNSPTPCRKSLDLTVLCDTEPGKWLLKTDAGIWKRVLLNLLGNALKYTTSGVIQVKLLQEDVQCSPQSKDHDFDNSATGHRLQASANQGWPSRTFSSGQTQAVFADGIPTSRVVLTVEDTGQGISSDYMAHHMFKPFYQENTMSPGTGLGLSIVSQLMTSIGGTTTVSSEVDVGTNVTVQCMVECSAPKVLEPFKRQGSKVGMFGLGVMLDPGQIPDGILDNRSRSLLLVQSSLTAYANNLGLVVMNADLADCEVDVMITTEAAYSTSRFNRPTIVLAAEPILHRGDSLKFNPAVILSQPFGAREFRHALELALSKAHEWNNATFTLPLLPSPGARDSVSNGKDPSKTTGPSLLLVEDNAINLKMLVASARKLGYKFETATDGLQALEAYRNEDFDVVVMDIQMPKMDGMEACRAIREYERKTGRKPTVIIALTALTAKDAEQVVIDSGANRFFSKPLAMRAFREVIDRICSG